MHYPQAPASTQLDALLLSRSHNESASMIAFVAFNYHIHRTLAENNYMNWNKNIVKL